MAEAIAPAGAPTPVMDVVAPPTEKEEKIEASMAEAAGDAPAGVDQKTDDKVSHPNEAGNKGDKSEHGNRTSPTEAPKPDHLSKHTPPIKPKEAAKSGVGLAIAATVVIVFGLAILAVYAYLQTNK